MDHSYHHNSPTQDLTAGKWHTGIRNTIRNHFIAMLGEFCGTVLFLFFSFAPAQIAVTAIKGAPGNLPNPADLLYIASAFGASLAVNVWAFYRINGGMLNPAVYLTTFFSHHVLMSFRLLWDFA
jgi:aquaporin rerated protein, other eukaryote